MYEVISETKADAIGREEARRKKKDVNSVYK